MCYIIATKCVNHKTLCMEELTYCDEGLTGVLCMDQQLTSKSMDLIVLNNEGRYAISLLNVMRVHEQDGYCETCMERIAYEIMSEEDSLLMTRNEMKSL